jgi:citrate synthase
MTDEVKFTQVDVDRIVSERLKREKETHGDNDALKAEIVTLKASLTTEQAAKLKLEGELSTKNDSELKAKIAKEVNLPEKLIPLITGKTEDEIRSAMKLMVESIGPGPAIGADTNPATSDIKRYTKQEVEKMSPADITKNWATIEAQLADGSLNH